MLDNVIIIFAACILAVIIIFLLYIIVMFQGIKNSKGNDLQITTKNILEQVEILYNKGEYTLVELLAAKYLDRVPNHKDVRQYLAKAYYQNQKYNNAIKQCSIILKKAPNNINTKKLLGDCFYKKQLYSKAIKEYEEIFDYKNTDKELVSNLAELYRITKQLYAAISVYNILAGLMDKKEDIAKIQLILATLNEEVQDYPAAFDAYKARLNIFPTDIATNRKLIELYIKINNYPKAIETLLFLLSVTNDQKVIIWVYETLVNLYVETEEYEKAIEYSNRLLNTQYPDKFKVRNDIALYNLKLKNYQAGINLLEDLVMMSQNGYEVTVELAEAYIQCKEYQKALDKYLALLDKATQKEAKDVRKLICRLYIMWAADTAVKSDYDKAFEYLETAMQYDNSNPEVYYNIALNNMNIKNYPVAVEYLHKALDYDKTKSNYTKYLLSLSEAHNALGNFFEEKKALSDLLKIDGQNPMGLYRSGLLHVSQHDTKEAEECFQKALQYDPNLLRAKYNLALIYESNNRDKAKELYMEILEQEPDFEEAKRALAELASSDYY